MLMLDHIIDKEGRAHTNVGTWAPVTLLRYWYVHVGLYMYLCLQTWVYAYIQYT